MSQKAQRKTPAQARADEALDRVAEFSSTPTAKALDFLLRGSHDDPDTPRPVSIPPQGTPPEGSLPTNHTLAYQKNSLPLEGSLPVKGRLNDTEPLDLMASLPAVDGYTKLWHQMTDHLYRQLTTPEQACHMQLFRLSWGFGKPVCRVGLGTIAERTGIARSAVQRAIDGLVKKGLIAKTQYTFGKGKVQGTEYTVKPPPASLPRESSLPYKGSLPVKGNYKEHTLKDTHNTESSVRVSSRFTLQECRRYAESLRKDGITNPGGYATKIYRSGEADELIAKFLEPVELTKPVDVSLCPDCHGTGFYEPGGAGKGVAKCKHERMLKVS